MEKPNPTEQQLEQLLADTLIANAPAPELMVQYAQDKTKLSNSEIKQIEQYIMSSPAAADEMRVLKTYQKNNTAAHPTKQTQSSFLNVTKFICEIKSWLTASTSSQWIPAVLAVLIIAPILIQLSLKEEILFTAPNYAHPSNALTPYWLNTSSRSATSLQLKTITPMHVGISSKNQPDLYWLINVLPESGNFEFNLVNSNTDKSILTKSITPNSSGIQTISLKNLKIKLKTNTIYRWSVSYSNKNQELYALGAIQIIPFSANIQDKINTAKTGNVINILAINGYWYDSVEKLYQLQKKYPQHTGIQNSWKKLIQSGSFK